MEKQLKILSIGAHPDDADTYSGGLLSKLRDAGWLVRLLSVTDGSAGTYHMDESAEELKLKRRSEAAASGRLLGGRYDVLAGCHHHQPSERLSCRSPQCLASGAGCILPADGSAHLCGYTVSHTYACHSVLGG